MEHATHKVDILDEDGTVIGQKARRDINKATDIYHTAHALVITPEGKIVLSVIPVREDLPNIYSKKIGTTMATIRRSGETAIKAAQRGLSRELFIDDADIVLLGESMLELPQNHKNYVSAYYVRANAPQSFSPNDIESLAIVSPNDLRDMVASHPEKLAPTFQQIWALYQDKLPI